MKTILLVSAIGVTVLTVLHQSVNAQVIPNFNFENWNAGSASAPDGWSDNGSNHPGFFPVTQTSDKYLGSYAVRLENKITASDTTDGRIYTTRPNGKEGFGPAFPISTRYSTLKGFYKYVPVNGDSAEIIVFITKTGYTNTQGWGNLLAWGQKHLGASATYAPFSVGYLDSLVNMYYDSPIVVPDSAYIDIAAFISVGLAPGNSPEPKGNSVLYIDALNFDTYLNGINGVLDITSDFTLYPNASNGIFDVSFTFNRSDYATIKIYDMSGLEIKNMFEGSLAGGEHKFHYDLRDVANGNYLFVVSTAKGYKAEKICIEK